MTLEYFLVDVFTKQPFSGNGLTIFPNAELLDKKLMQVLTQEMRQFESIFYQKIGLNTYRAYIFTMEEELDFAGHPILGLASQIHKTHSSEKLTNEISITLNEKTVEVTTHKKNGFYSASMNQGKPEFIGALESIRESEFLSALNLADEDKYKGLKLEIVSTGLPYLIIPVKSNSLSKVKVTVSDLEKKLSKIGAKFFYVLDIEKRRGRTWDNAGLVEDIATGSSAGPVGAYLVKNKLAEFNEEIRIWQGEFLNRKSELRIIVKGNNDTFEKVFVEGDVVEIANGKITNANNGYK
ncbi:PhzF family phenazine biosynthesis protein [Hwangdonia seohaensis]|uniref:PhzF family phenazine biosynthesis protein n=1 Tax=Hwangdonia seohaensis TaxID=1240727 RepID=A0ABW3R9T0_9FLAO|nr:PhzF family phenazine biosynthesis protein [Hwangdonia seohaensis]